jgi:hypothetical protein
MTRSFVTAALVLSLAGALSAGEPRAPKADPVLDALRKDPRLQSPVVVAAADQPLGEFLDGLAKRAGVILRASRETEDDRITLFSRDRPAAELLIQAALHFDFQWRRYRTGFELYQDLPARQRQAAAREAVRTAQLQAIQQRIQQVGALLGRPREQLTQQRGDLLKQMGNRMLTPAQRQEVQEQLAVVGAALQPGAALGVDFSRRLGPAQYGALRAGQEVRFSTQDGTLPPAMAAPIHEAARESRSVMRSVRIEAGPGGAAPQIAPAPENTAPPTGASVSIRFDRGPSGLFAGLGRRANQPPGLHFVFNSIRGGPGDQQVSPVTWTVPAPAPAAPAPGPGDADLEQEVELFPVARPAAGPPATGSGSGSAPAVRVFTPADALAGQIRLSRVAEKLHEKTGLNILADSFIRGRLPEAQLRGKRPVSYFLEQIARQLDYSWRKQQKTILFRDNVFYDDRPAEVPERLLAPWRSRLERAGTFSLDDLAEITATLADPQVLNLQNYWQWYLEGGKTAPPEAPHNLFSVREHLRFWAGLSNQQRRASRADIIPARLLNNGQKAAFTRAIVSGDGFAFREAVQAAPPSAAELQAGGFRLEVGTSQMHEFRGRAGDGGEEGQVVIRSIGVPRADGSAPMPALPPAARLPGGGELQLQAQSTTTLDNYIFRYHLAGNPQPARTVTIQVPRPAQKAAAPAPGR